MGGQEANLPRRDRNRAAKWLLAGVVCLLAGGLWWTIRQGPLRAASGAPRSGSEGVEATFEPPEILIIPEETSRSMRLAAVAARKSTQPHTLRLTGRLMYDPNELVHVNTRFAGEVIRIGEAPELGRPLRVGDYVRKGQLLAIVWSKEIGEKKSDLVDALSQMALHEALYKSLKALEKTGAISQRAIEEMERLYESDLIQVERYRRTLRSWKIDEAELAEVEQEAKEFHAHVTKPGDDVHTLQPPSKVDETWAEIDIKSPLDGVILEKNLTIGDIVDTNDDLFKVADLRRLIVMANLYEDDLPSLLSLSEDERVWEVRLTANPQAPPITGKIETIGNVIDPNQHTAVVQGWIDNSQDQLRVGQFVEAVISLPPRGNQVEIPLGGLIDDGPRKFVMVALDEQLTRLQRREVIVDRRTQQSAYVRGDGPLALHEGERVLVRGVLELSGVLDKLRPAAGSPR
jgi:cobalt-zinc-cadmium efflux system membrane fusion protein